MCCGGVLSLCGTRTTAAAPSRGLLNAEKEASRRFGVARLGVIVEAEDSGDDRSVDGDESTSVEALIPKERWLVTFESLLLTVATAAAQRVCLSALDAAFESPLLTVATAAAQRVCLSALDAAFESPALAGLLRRRPRSACPMGDSRSIWTTLAKEARRGTLSGEHESGDDESSGDGGDHMVMPRGEIAHCPALRSKPIGACIGREATR